MRTLKNIEDFEADYKKYYKGNLENLNFNEVLKEVKTSEDSYELRAFESNVNATVTFFFDEEHICVDEKLEEYDTIATYTSNSWN